MHAVMCSQYSFITVECVEARDRTFAFTTSVPASWMRAVSACALSAGNSTRGFAYKRQ